MSLTEIGSGSGLYFDEEGRILFGTTLRTTSDTAGGSYPADVSINGTISAFATNGEHCLSNDWSGQNVLRLHSLNLNGCSAVVFNAPGLYGQECGAIGVAPDNDVFGPRGTLYMEASNFGDLTKFGTYRGVQTKFGNYTLREEWKENGDLVFYDRKTPVGEERAVVTIKANGDLLLGDGSNQLDATDHFSHIPTCRGMPTGTPSKSYVGQSPYLFDELNNVIWVYNKLAGEWRGTAMPYPLESLRTAPVLSPVVEDVEELFDVAYVVPGPASCFTDTEGTVAAGEYDSLACFFATNGLKFVVSEGFTLEKRNGIWVIRSDGSGYARAATGGLAMQSAFTFTAITKRANGTSQCLHFGDDSTGERRALFVRDVSGGRIEFNGAAADYSSVVPWPTAHTNILVRSELSAVNIWKDSVDEASGSPSAALTAYASDEITIGANASGAERFVGEWARIGFASRRLTDVEVESYNAYSQPITAALN